MPRSYRTNKIHDYTADFFSRFICRKQNLCKFAGMSYGKQTHGKLYERKNGKFSKFRSRNKVTKMGLRVWLCFVEDE